MPGGVVDTPRDEHKWDRAKEIAAEAGKGGNYAYIMGIYKNMKPDHTFKASLSDNISRLARTVQASSDPIYRKHFKRAMSRLTDALGDVTDEFDKLPDEMGGSSAMDAFHSEIVAVQDAIEDLDSGLGDISGMLGGGTTAADKAVTSAKHSRGGDRYYETHFKDSVNWLHRGIGGIAHELELLSGYGPLLDGQDRQLKSLRAEIQKTALKLGELSYEIHESSNSE